jgi:hypothetical protein
MEVKVGKVSHIQDCLKIKYHNCALWFRLVMKAWLVFFVVMCAMMRTLYAVFLNLAMTEKCHTKSSAPRKFAAKNFSFAPIQSACLEEK